MERHKKGDLTEAQVIAELKARNIPVATPVGDNERYDLVIEAPKGELLRAQVKTPRWENGSLLFDGESQHSNSKGNTRRSYAGDVDCFLVYSHDIESLYFIPASEVGCSMQLRVEDPACTQPSINWARDYEFTKQWSTVFDEQFSEEHLEMPPNRRGDATEAKVIAELLYREIPIAIPPTDNERYDLLAWTQEGSFYRLQIKTGQIKNGRLQSSAFSVHTNASGNVHKPYNGEIDYFLIYSPEHDKMYLVKEGLFEYFLSIISTCASRN